MNTLINLIRLLFNNRSSLQAAFDRDLEDRYRANLKATYGKTKLPTVDILNLLNKNELSIENYTYLRGNSLPTDMALIKELAAVQNDCVFLEIGSWRGETLSNVAKVARRCFSLTLSPEEMISKGISSGFIDSHAIFTNGLQNIEEFLHDSATFDYSRLPEKPSLIFVDGDHSYNGVLIDTRNAFKVLRDDDSVIIWHDYGYDTEEVRASVMAAIVDGTPPHLRKYLYHVSNTMCAIFIRKEFETTTVKFPTYPNKKFEVSMRIEKL